MGTLPSADGSIEYLHHAVHVYTYKAFVLTVSCSMKSMELETDSCSYCELVKQSALNSYHIAWLLGYIHVSNRRIDAQRRIATYSQCQPLFSTIQMTGLLAAVLAPSGPTDSASISTMKMTCAERQNFIRQRRYCMSF